MAQISNQIQELARESAMLLLDRFDRLDRSKSFSDMPVQESKKSATPPPAPTPIPQVFSPKGLQGKGRERKNSFSSPLGGSPFQDIKERNGDRGRERNVTREPERDTERAPHRERSQEHLERTTKDWEKERQREREARERERERERDSPTGRKEREDRDPTIDFREARRERAPRIDLQRRDSRDTRDNGEAKNTWDTWRRPDTQNPTQPFHDSRDPWDIMREARGTPEVQTLRDPLDEIAVRAVRDTQFFQHMMTDPVALRLFLQNQGFLIADVPSHMHLATPFLPSDIPRPQLALPEPIPSISPEAALLNAALLNAGRLRVRGRSRDRSPERERNPGFRTRSRSPSPSRNRVPDRDQDRGDCNRDQDRGGRDQGRDLRGWERDREKGRIR